MKTIVLIIASCLSVANAIAGELPNRATDLCQGWRFEREDAAVTSQPASGPEQASISFDDSHWEAVSLPHAVKVESPELGDKYFLGDCWYRRVIPVDAAWKGRRVWLEFDGAMQATDIWVNGEKTGTHLGGYLPFVVDLSSQIAGHDRVIVALHLDNRARKDFPPGSNRVDFNYAGGLYRPARLIVTDPVHITNPIEADRVAGGGVFVRCESADAAEASVLAETDVRNDGLEPTDVDVEHVLLAPDGSEVAKDKSVSQAMPVGGETQFVSTLMVTHPKLWHPDHPWLYTLVSTVYKNQTACDQVRTRCGIRWLSVTEDGFFLNGEKLVIRGANRHMSFPWLGNAGSDNMQYRDIRLLKEEGFNFLRLCHYPQSSATMDACDELGVMALVCTPGWQYFGNSDSFKSEAKKNIREMVRWHRNHPSAVLWETSLNETYGHDTFYKECSDLAHAEYPGGQLLTGGDTYSNHQVGFYDLPYAEARSNHTDYMHKVGLTREYGDYQFGGQSSTTRVPRGGLEERLLLQAWNFQWNHNENLSQPWVAGDAIWCGIDAASSFDKSSAGLGSWWGPVDLYRLPKFSYYFFQSQRDPAVKQANCDSGPMVRIAGYWTPPPSPAKVIVYSNCEEVELLLNGKSLGIRKPDDGPDTAYQGGKPGKDKPPGSLIARVFDGGNCKHLVHPPFTFSTVNYEPGELTAIGRIGGQSAAKDKLRTPGKPASLRLRAAELGKPLFADGSDSLFVYAEVVDSAGEVVPENAPAITFHAEGAGHLVMPAEYRTEAGIAPMMVQSDPIAGTITITAESPGITPAKLEVQSLAR